jgi:hypothetical protein
VISSSVPTLCLGLCDLKHKGSSIFQNTLTTTHPTTVSHSRRLEHSANCCQNIRSHKQTLQFNDGILTVYKQCKHILEKCNPTSSLLLFLYDKFDKFCTRCHQHTVIYCPSSSHMSDGNILTLHRMTMFDFKNKISS